MRLTLLLLLISFGCHTGQVQPNKCIKYDRRSYDQVRDILKHCSFHSPSRVLKCDLTGKENGALRFEYNSIADFAEEQTIPFRSMHATYISRTDRLRGTNDIEIDENGKMIREDWQGPKAGMTFKWHKWDAKKRPTAGITRIKKKCPAVQITVVYTESTRTNTMKSPPDAKEACRARVDSVTTTIDFENHIVKTVSRKGDKEKVVSEEETLDSAELCY